MVFYSIISGGGSKNDYFYDEHVVLVRMYTLLLYSYSSHLKTICEH